MKKIVFCILLLTSAPCYPQTFQPYNISGDSVLVVAGKYVDGDYGLVWVPTSSIVLDEFGWTELTYEPGDGLRLMWDWNGEGTGPHDYFYPDADFGSAAWLYIYPVGLGYDFTNETPSILGGEDVASAAYFLGLGFLFGVGVVGVCLMIRGVLMLRQPVVET